jgi:hypothetical protein
LSDGIPRTDQLSSGLGEIIARVKKYLFMKIFKPQTIKVIFTGFIIFGSLQASEVTYGNFTRDQGFNLEEVPVLTLKEGELFEVISANARTPKTVINIKIKPEGTDSLMWQRWWVVNDRATKLRNTMSDGTTSEPPSQLAVGPCDIVLSTFVQTGPVTGPYRISYKITKPSPVNTSPPILLPPTEDPSKNWFVKLQVSTDLKNWDDVEAGQFLGSNTARFFRIQTSEEGGE